MKKALILHSDFGIGGAERLMLDVGLTTKRLGYQVDYYTNYFNRNRCFEEFNTERLNVVSMFGWIPMTIYGKFQVLIALLKMLLMSWWVIVMDVCVHRNNQYSLVITDGAGYISVPLFKLFGYKVLFYCHFPDQLLVTNKSWLSRVYRAPIDFIEEKCTACADVIAVNSNFTKNVVLQQFPTIQHIYSSRPNFIQIVYPCVDCSKYNNFLCTEDKLCNISLRFLPRNTQPIGDNDNISDILQLNTPRKYRHLFLCLNRFERKKKLSIAVKAFHQLKLLSTKNNQSHLFDDSLLVVMGGYDERVFENVSYEVELNALVKSLDIHNNVVFLRSPSDKLKKQLLSIATAVLYTPSNEHFGIVPVEAMASGCPVIAVKSGGPLETVIPGQTGYLCEDSPNEFAQMMYTIVSDPKLAGLFNKNGVRHVQENFSINKFQKVISQIISTLI